MSRLSGTKAYAQTGLDTGDDRPAYVRICERIRTAITSGALALNARLPSSRTLAKGLGVARNTVDVALGQLVGVLEGRERALPA